MELMKKGEVFVAEWVDPEDAMPPMDFKYGIGVSDAVLVHIARCPGVDFGTIRVAWFWHGEGWKDADGNLIEITLPPKVKEYYGHDPKKQDAIVTHWMRIPNAPFIKHPNPQPNT